jgi:putative FmdB family regulatory protein
MPIFEYICNDCGRGFEKILPRHDSTAECPHCNSESVEKQLSVFSVAGPSQDFAPAAEGGCGRCGAATPGSCAFEN